MTSPDQVELGELEKALSVLLTHVREVHGGAAIELRSDLFWSLPNSQLYDVTSEPPELGIGQLTDSLAELRRMTNGPTDEVLTYGLTWLADVLRYLTVEVVG